ncbi:MAG TPA: DnaA regulatory inactivator Hda, partial [Gammaproteobacteria bacterium]|nr:DnaA regulatory inactivator Hda [Gammaproteobacteria bacterium]
MNVQLPLGIALERGASFTTFWPAGNEAALAALQERSDTNLYLWGERATGKTHLLQAACAAAGAGRAAYLPCAELERFVPQVIEGWESLGLVCLDDVHLIAGRREWEHAVFTLYEALRENGGR